eukprot:CAMPEP_0202702766 /NCGR_PEP_ID=MMETSP1385-20130828/15699_1 /ASSEMBLY_ACC=CAM_ASM_000861 /TAXON_ID=933848 /ORGANISM="Elphidium margaritaceum" /LENGTH=294 /DNA_ID=CAMNT_0049360477 /DNA_START=59 /DNA_END=943 /DNA_ORIENTATION=+
MNYLSLTNIFGGRDRGCNGGERSTLTDPFERERGSMTTSLSQITPMQSVQRSMSFTSIPRNDSDTSSLSSVPSLPLLPSCTRSTHSVSTPSASADNDDDRTRGQYQNRVLKRRHSVSVLPRYLPNDTNAVEDTDVMDQTFKIKVSCNNCYVWRRKCQKQEQQSNKLTSDLDRQRTVNVELMNKKKSVEKTLKLQQKEMALKMKDLERINAELAQQNMQQSQHSEDILIENITLQQENEILQEHVEQSNKQATKLFAVIDSLQKRISDIETKLKQKQHDQAQDINNPWLWMLRMT